MIAIALIFFHIDYQGIVLLIFVIINDKPAAKNKLWHRMNLQTRRIFLLFAIIFALLISFSWVKLSRAADKTNRRTDIVISYTQYEWWLLKWSDNSLQCQILTDHDGLPTDDDIYVYCGEELYEKWLDTTPCDAVIEEKEKASSCKGFYLHPVASEVLTKTIQVELPSPEAWIDIQGCELTITNNLCTALPTLVITGFEPLPNEEIIGIQGTYNDIPFICEGNRCEIPIRPTSVNGALIEFWADSSFGDSSEHYTALIRAIETGIKNDSESSGWYVDIMSTRMVNAPLNTCAQTWESFPPLGGPPSWLDTPDASHLLATDEPYTFLAGQLIAQGIVDASQCPAGGLEENGYANTCGLETARPVVDEWQNLFDAQIITVSHKTGIPAQLIKNIFAIESQFWPGIFENGQKEFGFGQLTELGADAVLLWNPTFYNEFCPLVLNAEVCAKGYAQLEEEDQATLRGAVASNASAVCEDCPQGIDLSRANSSIDLFAQTIQANCTQVGQIVTNLTGQSPGAVASYEDLWRFTLSNYHGGPGCLQNALKELPQNKPMTWENISPLLDEECPGVVEYVEKVSR